MNSMLEKVKGYIKIPLTLGLLALIGTQANLGELGKTIVVLDLVPLLVAILLGFTAVVLSAYKWQVLLHSQGLVVGLGQLIRIYFVGLFFNNFLPSSIGGDVMRVVKVAQITGKKVEVTASVVMERLLATLALGFLAFVALIPKGAVFTMVYPYIISFTLICIMMVFLVWAPGKVWRLDNDSRWQWMLRLKSAMGRLFQEMDTYKENPGAMLRVFGYSVLFQLLIVFMNVYIFKAMGLGMDDWWHLVLVVPLISAISMVPFSINGLGVREGAYILLLAPLGISSTKAVTGSLVFFVIVTGLSLLGGVFYILETTEGVLVNEQYE